MIIRIILTVSLSLFTGHVITKAMNNHIHFQLENAQNATQW